MPLIALETLGRLDYLTRSTSLALFNRSFDEFAPKFHHFCTIFRSMNSCGIAPNINYLVQIRQKNPNK